MSDNIDIVYDKQCPACSAYCEMAQASGQPAPVNLIDARDESDLMAEITARGWDIDDGMVVRLQGSLYYGAEAIHELARRDTGRRLFNRINRLLFKHPRAARVLYPCLRSVRNLLLKLLGVGRINNLGVQGRDRF